MVPWNAIGVHMDSVGADGRDPENSRADKHSESPRLVILHLCSQLVVVWFSLHEQFIVLLAAYNAIFDRYETGFVGLR